MNCENYREKVITRATPGRSLVINKSEAPPHYTLKIIVDNDRVPLNSSYNSKSVGE